MTQARSSSGRRADLAGSKALYMNLRRDQLAALVARTDYYPLRLVYRAIYWLATRYLKTQLLRQEGILGIYLTGSYTRNDQLHGVSDIDVYVVIEGRYQEDDIHAQRLKDCFQHCLEVFPFLGPLEERLSQVVFTREDGTAKSSSLQYRQRCGLLVPMFERRGFALRASSSTAQEELGELTLQARMIVRAMILNKDNLYFWKRRLRALERVLKYTCGELKDTASEPTINWLKQLMQTDNYKLYRSIDSQDCSRCFSSFLELSGLIITRLKVMQANEITIPFEYLGEGARQACFVPTEDASAAVQIIDARGSAYEELKQQLQKGQAIRSKPLLCSFDDLIVLWDGREATSSNCLTAPWVFAGEQASELTFGCDFWQYLNQHVEESVAHLKATLFGEAQAEPDFDGCHSNSPASNLDDHAYVNALINLYRLNCLSRNGLRIFSDKIAALRNLQLQLPEHREFLGLLIQYVGEANEDNGSSLLLEFPNNFLAYAGSFFKALLDGATLPPANQLHKHLSLSLCVLTRDRTETLIEMLESVLKQRRSPDEVLIVDNSSSEMTKEALKPFLDKLPLKYVFSESHLVPHLRNVAINESSGEIICFTDDDCVLDPDWLLHVERVFLRNEMIGAVGGIVRHYMNSAKGTVEQFHEAYLG